MARTASMQPIAPAGPKTGKVLLDSSDTTRLHASARLASRHDHRVQPGKFFTPEPIARFTGSVFEFPALSKTPGLLDGGGGHSGVPARDGLGDTRVWQMRPVTYHVNGERFLGPDEQA